MFDRATIQSFGSALRGEVIDPSSPAYDQARKVYNGMIDRRPALIVRCADAEDAAAALRLGMQQDVPIAIRSGAHNAGGLSVCNDGVVLDLGKLKKIRIDAEARCARVEAGCVWSEVDAATHPFGMAVPCGIVGSTGVGGLTLGGGTGH